MSLDSGIIEISEIPDKPGKAHLKIDKITDAWLALQIFNLIMKSKQPKPDNTTLPSPT